MMSCATWISRHQGLGDAKQVPLAWHSQRAGTLQEVRPAQRHLQRSARRSRCQVSTAGRFGASPVHVSAATRHAVSNNSVKPAASKDHKASRASRRR